MLTWLTPLVNYPKVNWIVHLCQEQLAPIRRSGIVPCENRWSIKMDEMKKKSSSNEKHIEINMFSSLLKHTRVVVTCFFVSMAQPNNETNHHSSYLAK